MIILTPMFINSLCEGLADHRKDIVEEINVNLYKFGRAKSEMTSRKIEFQLALKQKDLVDNCMQLCKHPDVDIEGQTSALLKLSASEMLNTKRSRPHSDDKGSTRRDRSTRHVFTTSGIQGPVSCY